MTQMEYPPDIQFIKQRKIGIADSFYIFKKISSKNNPTFEPYFFVAHVSFSYGSTAAWLCDEEGDSVIEPNEEKYDDDEHHEYQDDWYVGKDGRVFIFDYDTRNLKEFIWAMSDYRKDSPYSLRSMTWKIKTFWDENKEKMDDEIKEQFMDRFKYIIG